MKKFFLASVFALVGLGLSTTPTILAQDAAAGSIEIKDRAEFNAYQDAVTQTDPKAKAAASETFLSTYPQSVVKKTVLAGLVDAYSSFDPAKAVDAATRMLQLDPNDLKSMYLIVFIKKQQAGQAANNPTQQAQLLDDAAAMATKGLAATKPDAMKDEDFKKLKATTDPFFHSAIAQDDAISKKDLKAAIAEFRSELEATPVDQTTKGSALNDTLTLGQAYTQLAPPDPVNAVWFLARAEDYAPDSFKPTIDKQAKYWYKRYHGNTDGFDDIKAKAQASLFPPTDFAIKPADTPADIANKFVTDNAKDLASQALGDKEFALANASKENAELVWATLKDQVTQLPGTVIAATASQIQLAVTDDAKADKKADFTINMKTPLTDKEIPAVGSDVTNLIGTFDSYTQTPPQIVLRDGEFQVEKKKPVARKPAAGHKKAS